MQKQPQFPFDLAQSRLSTQSPRQPLLLMNSQKWERFLSPLRGLSFPCTATQDCASLVLGYLPASLREATLPVHPLL